MFTHVHTWRGHDEMKDYCIHVFVSLSLSLYIRSLLMYIWLSASRATFGCRCWPPHSVLSSPLRPPGNVVRHPGSFLHPRADACERHQQYMHARIPITGVVRQPDLENANASGFQNAFRSPDSLRATLAAPAQQLWLHLHKNLPLGVISNQ